MKSFYLILVSLLVSLSSSWAQASIIQYSIDFMATGGPSSGIGGFTFEECDNNVICPNLQFESSFGSGLEYDIDHVGGSATFLFEFFTLRNDPGTNFSSLDGFTLLSFEDSGAYCLRPQAIAQGACAEDFSAFGRGTWSVAQVPAPPCDMATRYRIGWIGVDAT